MRDLEKTFLTKRADFTVTKIYAYYTFKLEPFKGDFIIVNQISRQQAKMGIKNDLCKLLNSPHFGLYE